MRDVGFIKTDNKWTELRQREPQWNLPPQYTALALGISRRSSLPGHDEDEPCAIPLRAAHEMYERIMRLALRHAVQIDLGIDRVAAARNALLLPLVERCERRRFFRQGC